MRKALIIGRCGVAHHDVSTVVYLQMKGHDTTDHPVMIELVSRPKAIATQTPQQSAELVLVFAFIETSYGIQCQDQGGRDRTKT
jgi:hypothetical protein